MISWASNHVHTPRSCLPTLLHIIYVRKSGPLLVEQTFKQHGNTWVGDHTALRERERERERRERRERVCVCVCAFAHDIVCTEG